jgi:hypothetical protein
MSFHQSSCYRQAISHATSTRGDHTGVGALCAIVIGVVSGHTRNSCSCEQPMGGHMTPLPAVVSTSRMGLHSMVQDSSGLLRRLIASAMGLPSRPLHKWGTLHDRVDEVCALDHAALGLYFYSPLVKRPPERTMLSRDIFKNISCSRWVQILL